MIPSCLVFYQHHSELGRITVSDTTSFYVPYLTTFSASNIFAHNCFLIWHSSYNTLLADITYKVHIYYVHLAEGHLHSHQIQSATLACPNTKTSSENTLIPFIFWRYKLLHHCKKTVIELIYLGPKSRCRKEI